MWIFTAFCQFETFCILLRFKGEVGYAYMLYAIKNRTKIINYFFYHC